MTLSIPLLLAAQADTQASQAYLPSYFVPVFFALLVAGLIVSLVAVVLGFGRTRAFGPAARWFALATMCLVLFQLHFVVMGLVAVRANASVAFPLIAGLNLFILLAAICLAIGFARLKARNDELQPPSSSNPPAD